MVPFAQYPAISTAGLASLFGSTIIAIPFLLDLLELPQDLFQVFITVDVLGSRFGTLLAAVHIITIALIGTLALQGRVRVRLVPLARFAGTTVVILAAALIGIRVFYSYAVVAPYTKDQALKSLHLLAEPQPARVHTEVPQDLHLSGDVQPASFKQIRTRGALRVCYTPDDYPAAFLNDEEPPQLVGFDIEMSHRFAKSLDLALEFLPVENEVAAATRLEAGACDVFFSSKAVDAGRVESFAITVPMYEASVGFIVEDHRRDAFKTWDAVRALGASLRLAVPNTADTIARAKAAEKNRVRSPIAHCFIVLPLSSPLD